MLFSYMVGSFIISIGRNNWLDDKQLPSEVSSG